MPERRSRRQLGWRPICATGRGVPSTCVVTTGPHGWTLAREEGGPMGAKQNLELIEELQRAARDLDLERYGQRPAADATLRTADVPAGLAGCSPVARRSWTSSVRRRARAASRSSRSSATTSRCAWWARRPPSALSAAVPAGRGAANFHVRVHRVSHHRRQGGGVDRVHQLARSLRPGRPGRLEHPHQLTRHRPTVLPRGGGGVRPRRSSRPRQLSSEDCRRRRDRRKRPQRRRRASCRGGGTPLHRVPRRWADIVGPVHPGIRGGATTPTRSGPLDKELPWPLIASSALTRISFVCT